jgi:hypothetical protein
MPERVKELGRQVATTLRVPRWNHWVAYGDGDFNATYAWMVEQGLAPKGHTSSEVVASNSPGVFH